MKRKRKRHQTPSSPPKAAGGFLGFWRKIPKWPYACLGFLGILITLLEFFPWLSIAQGDRLDPTNPFSQMFVAKNEGYAFIFEPEVNCTAPYKIAKDGGLFFDMAFQPGMSVHSHIEHTGTFSVPCDSAKLTGANHFPGSRMDMEVSYGFWPTHIHWLRRSQSFHFVTVSWDGSNQQWQQE